MDGEACAQSSDTVAKWSSDTVAKWSSDTVAKWLRHSTVDQKVQLQIPPVATRVKKCFLYPSSIWETRLWLKGSGGKNKHLYLFSLLSLTLNHRPAFLRANPFQGYPMTKMTNPVHWSGFIQWGDFLNRCCPCVHCGPCSHAHSQH